MKAKLRTQFLSGIHEHKLECFQTNEDHLAAPSPSRFFLPLRAFVPSSLNPFCISTSASRDQPPSPTP